MSKVGDGDAAPRVRRRDFLKISAGAVGAYALVKAGAVVLVGPRPAPASVLKHLSSAQASIVRAAAPLVIGPAGAAALAAEAWHPERDVDALLDNLAPDQRRLLGVALHLFEHWGLSWRGFSRRPPEEQAARLGAWRTSPLALKRTVWGFLHATCSASFASSPAGFSAMGYPGPCVPSNGSEGRAPGQSVAFLWDEVVP